jgi:hypothetical protein
MDLPMDVTRLLDHKAEAHASVSRLTATVFNPACWSSFIILVCRITAVVLHVQKQNKMACQQSADLVRHFTWRPNLKTHYCSVAGWLFNARNVMFSKVLQNIKVPGWHDQSLFVIWLELVLSVMPGVTVTVQGKLIAI